MSAPPRAMSIQFRVSRFMVRFFSVRVVV
jgi:hypothetical protein